MDPAEGTAALLKVQVAYCPAPGVNELVDLQLPTGATLGDALHASGLLQRHGLSPESLRAGIWCKPKDLSTPLREHDRVELYRPLLVDPKEARRQRYRRQKDAPKDTPAAKAG